MMAAVQNGRPGHRKKRAIWLEDEGEDNMPECEAQGRRCRREGLIEQVRSSWSMTRDSQGQINDMNSQGRRSRHNVCRTKCKTVLCG